MASRLFLTIQEKMVRKTSQDEELWMIVAICPCCGFSVEDPDWIDEDGAYFSCDCGAEFTQDEKFNTVVIREGEKQAEDMHSG